MSFCPICWYYSVGQRRFATDWNMKASEGDWRTLSCVNLTSARGESRAVEVVLFHFVIPAVCHILSCVCTGQSVTSTYRTIKSVLCRTYWSERQRCKRTATWSYKSLLGTCSLQCCTFLSLQCCTIGDFLWITRSRANIFLQWVMMSELSSTVGSGGEIDPSCSLLG